MKNIEYIKQFKDQSTWRLLGLGLVTYGVYFAYYIKKQTSKLNLVGDSRNVISSTLVELIMFSAYISCL